MKQQAHKKRHRVEKHFDEKKNVTARGEKELEGFVEKIENPFLLLLDHVQDPHNLGACFRSADAAGVDAIIIPKDRAVSITQTVRHVASGAAETVPLFVVTNLKRTIKQLKEQNFWFVGTSDHAEKTIYEVDYSGSLGIVMGCEEKGLSPTMEKECDHLVKIPMHGSVECLNVSVATGVVLFEAVRRRGR